MLICQYVLLKQSISSHSRMKIEIQNVDERKLEKTGTYCIFSTYLTRDMVLSRSETSVFRLNMINVYRPVKI